MGSVHPVIELLAERRKMEEAEKRYAIAAAQAKAQALHKYKKEQTK